MIPLLSLIVAVALLAIPSDCWKPIVGPPTTFSLHQSHPGYGAKSHSINTLGGSDLPHELIPESKVDPLGQGISLQAASTGSGIGSDSGEDNYGYKYTNPRVLTAAIFGEVRFVRNYRVLP